MGTGFSTMFGVTDEEGSDEHLQLSDLGGFLSKYIFIMLDKEKKKLVSKQEYLTLVNHFREQKTSEEELDNFLEKQVGDGNSTEYIDESLFKKLIVQLAVDFDRNIVERMRYLMTLFDKDEDGFVNEADLCQVYDAIGIQIPMDPIRCLITKFDVDGDGKLSVDEFEQLGRAAMNKLFIRKEDPSQPEPSLEDALVEEAILKATAVTETTSRMAKAAERNYRREGNGDSVNPDMLNNNLMEDAVAAFMARDKINLGKPVVLQDEDSLRVEESSESAEVAETA